MESTLAKAKLAPEIRRKLSALRWRIRGYIWLQGLSVAAIWLAATFWLGLAADYLPVLLGASEMPRVARGLLLVVIAAVLACIIYRWIGRRILVPLTDRSMAVLMERQFNSLEESLITSVEMSGEFAETTPLNRQMLAATQLKALRNLRGLPEGRVLNFRPLALNLVGAAALILTVGAFYAVDAHAWGLGVRRIYLLGDQPWPRNARIEIVGIEATRLLVDSEASTIVPFVDGNIKVARGSSVRLVVRADGAADVVPTVCSITYHTSENDRGRVNMTRVGQIRDGFQLYTYDGKPLKGILSDVRFDVLGFDHRVRDHVISVVDSPTVVEADLECEFPAYMVDPATSSWMPRSVPLSTGTRLPRGTSVVLRGASNKPLREVRIVDPGSGDRTRVTLEPGTYEFAHDLGPLQGNVGLEVTLVDTDNVISESPYRVFVEAVEDLPPLINVRLEGIGTAVTPDVLIALQGRIKDDYGVESSWIEMLINDGAPREVSFPHDREEVRTELDFRQLRRRDSDRKLDPEDKLYLTVKARDKCDLDVNGNVGISDAYQLDVVTPEQLLAMLETREFGLRERFEQIIDEMSETRDALTRIKNEGPEAAGKMLEVRESVEAEDRVELLADAARRLWSLRRLRAQQALLQSQKSEQETLGVAASFRDIRAELVNNRVDSQDRKERLEKKIAAPLERIGRDLFPRLEGHLEKLLATMDGDQETDSFLAQDNPATVTAAQKSIDQANEILVNLDEVLQSMKDLEDYNELLDIVRSLIADQQRLIGRAKQEQKKQVLDLQ